MVKLLIAVTKNKLKDPFTFTFSYGGIMDKNACQVVLKLDPRAMQH